jgi:hypothetical protein
MTFLSKSGHKESDEYNHFGGVLCGKEAQKIYKSGS